MAARDQLLSPLKKREILYSAEVTVEEKTEWGRRYLAAGRMVDALDFFVEAGSRTDLEEMRRKAVEEGDAFILRAIERVAPELVDESHWQALANTARTLGKTVFAEQAGRGGEIELPVIDAVIQEDPTDRSDDGGPAPAGEAPEPQNA